MDDKDTASYCRSMVKVARHKSSLQHHSLVVVLILTAILVVWLLIPNKKQSARQLDQQSMGSTSPHNDMSANLRQLHRLQIMRQQHKKSQPQNNISARQHLVTQQQVQTQQRQYALRQNAPTTIYHADPPSLKNSIDEKNDTELSTFKDGSGYSHFANQTFIANTLTAKKLLHPEDTLMSGELIPATLESSINSDLPGMVRAITNRPVYSYTGNRVLIPAGSRLLGQYSSMTMHGIQRVFIIWQRIILPQGVTVDINSPSTDTLGQSGQAADVTQTHFFARFGQSVLLSMIGAGVANDGVNGNDEDNSAAEYRSAMAQSLQQEAQSSVTATAPIKPTLVIYQGSAIKVFVAHDVSFYNVTHV